MKNLKIVQRDKENWDHILISITLFADENHEMQNVLEKNGNILICFVQTELFLSLSSVSHLFFHSSLQSLLF